MIGGWVTATAATAIVFFILAAPGPERQDPRPTGPAGSAPGPVTEASPQAVSASNPFEQRLRAQQQGQLAAPPSPVSSMPGHNPFQAWIEQQGQQAHTSPFER